MVEEVELQTINEVRTIDYMRDTNEIINNTVTEQNNAINNISDNLDTITEAIVSSPIASDVDLSEVTEKIEEIDTSIVEENTQDILSIVNKQQNQIDEINEKLDMILEKL